MIYQMHAQNFHTQNVNRLTLDINAYVQQIHLELEKLNI